MTSLDTNENGLETTNFVHKTVTQEEAGRAAESQKMI